MTCLHVSNAGGALNLRNPFAAWKLRPLDRNALRVFECSGLFLLVSPVECSAVWPFEAVVRGRCKQH